MTDNELGKFSTQLIKQTVAESVGKAAIDPSSIETELNKINRYKALLLIHLKIIDDGIKFISSFSREGSNNDRV